jgi:hypothetical protein
MTFSSLGCSNQDTQVLTTKQSAIVGGIQESGYRAVGALIEDGEASCTGTLIGVVTFLWTSSTKRSSA